MPSRFGKKKPAGLASRSRQWLTQPSDVRSLELADALRRIAQPSACALKD
jgi:hypothetical protein